MIVVGLIILVPLVTLKEEGGREGRSVSEGGREGGREGV